MIKKFHSSLRVISKIPLKSEKHLFLSRNTSMSYKTDKTNNDETKVGNTVSKPFLILQHKNYNAETIFTNCSINNSSKSRNSFVSILSIRQFWCGFRDSLSLTRVSLHRALSFYHLTSWQIWVVRVQVAFPLTAIRYL